MIAAMPPATCTVLGQDGFSTRLLLWSLLLVLPLGVRLTDFWQYDLAINATLALAIMALFAFGLPRAAESPRRKLRLLRWGKIEWAWLALFITVQLQFLFDPLAAGRDYQPDLMAAAVNAMRLGAGTLPSPLAPLVIIGLAVLAGLLVKFRPRLRWHALLWLALLAGVTMLAHGLPLATTASPAPVGMETLWLTLCGINEPAHRVLLLLVCGGAGLLWHQLGWRVTGSRAGALLVLALVWFNPATLHYAHTGITVPAVLLLTAVLWHALVRLQRKRSAAPAAWVALLVTMAWHPLLMVAGVFLPVAMLKEDETLVRAARVRLWISAWLAALLVTAVRGLSGVSGMEQMLLPAELWSAPVRLLLPWLALPVLLTYFIVALALIHALHRLTCLPKWAGMLPVGWLLLAGGLLLPLPAPLPWLLLAALALLTLPAAVAFISSGEKLADRLALAGLAGTLGVAAATVSATKIEWWLFALPGITLLAARLLARVMPPRLPVWLPALAVGLPLGAAGLFSAGSEWQNLATRNYYQQAWPEAARAVAGLPGGTGLYCPLPDSPLPFYLAGARVFDRLRLVTGPWLTTEYQRVDSLFEWCVVKRCRFAIIPRGYYLDNNLPSDRRTLMTQLADEYPALPAGFAWPGAWSQTAVNPRVGEDLLTDGDIRFAVRALYGRTGNQLLLVEVGTLEMAQPATD